MDGYLLSLFRCDECKSRPFITSTASSTENNRKKHSYMHILSLVEKTAKMQTKARLSLNRLPRHAAKATPRQRKKSLRANKFA